MRRNIIYYSKLKQVLLIVAAFLFAEMSSAAHRHELHQDLDKAPDHQICSVCLIATESDSEADVDNDDTDGETVNLLYQTTVSIPVNIMGPQTVSVVKRAKPPPHQTVQPYLLSRAPPLMRQSII